MDLNWKPDIVILSHVVEHFTEPVSELRKLREVIHSDSRIYVEVPGVKHLSPIRDWYHGDFQEQLQTAHTYYFTAKSLRNLLRKSGFESVYTDEYVHSIFKPTEGDKKAGFESDYDDVMAHLNRLEWGQRLRLQRLVNPGNTAKAVYRKVSTVAPD